MPQHENLCEPLVARASYAIRADNPGQSDVIVQIPVTIDEEGNRDRLDAVRRAYSLEVVSTSPGTYEWRSPRTEF
jgi:hypothetical protein